MAGLLQRLIDWAVVRGEMVSSSCWMESGGAFLSEIQACFFLFGVIDGDHRPGEPPYRPVLIQLLAEVPLLIPRPDAEREWCLSAEGQALPEMFLIMTCPAVVVAGISGSFLSGYLISWLWGELPGGQP